MLLQDCGVKIQKLSKGIKTHPTKMCDVYVGFSQTFMVKLFAKIVNGF